MKKAQFRPCIDLHGGVVKQMVGSSLGSNAGTHITNFVAPESPAYYAELYKQDQLFGGHVIKLGQGNDAAALEALRAWRGGLQIGGGITPDNAEYFLAEGASHVIVTSCVFSNGMLNEKNLELLLSRCGKEHLVLDLSCRKRDGKYFVVTDLWQKFTSFEVNQKTLEELGNCCAEFLIHAVDVEGKCAGIDRDLLEILSCQSPVDCVYAGGIRSFDDVKIIENAGKGKVHYTIGSALDLFGGTLSYREICNYCKA